MDHLGFVTVSIFSENAPSVDDKLTDKEKKGNGGDDTADRGL